MDDRTWIQKKIEAMVTNYLGYYYENPSSVESVEGLKDHLYVMDLRVLHHECASSLTQKVIDETGFFVPTTDNRFEQYSKLLQFRYIGDK